MDISNKTYQNFLHGQDLIWTELPYSWDEGPFLGNGCTGLLVYVDKENGKLQFKPGRTDIYDNRKLEWYSIMDKQFQQPRLQLGPVELNTKTKLTGCNLRLDIQNGILEGSLTTEIGSIELSVWVPHSQEAIIIDLKPSSEESVSLDYIPMPAESPRQTKMREFNDYKRYRKEYEPPKPAYLPIVENNTILYEQPLFTTGSYVVAIQSEVFHNIISIGFSDTDGQAIEEAKKYISNLNKDLTFIKTEHKNFWNSVFTRSFFSTDDPVWENYYWIQLYKMACMARPGGRIIDTMGPWAITTSWPSGFWNLNVQLTYAPMIPTGLFDVARSLPDQLLKEKENLNLNIVPEYRDGCFGIGTNTCRSLRSEVSTPFSNEDPAFKVELGNLTWVLFDCYTLYKTTLDEEMLTTTILPLLKGAVKYYMHFLERDDKGILHLQPTESPEYCIVDWDTNYDLALLTWGLKTLILENQRLNKEKDNISLWEKTLNDLTPFPEDPVEGLLIARNTHLAKSHRHYSHLLSFYPLHLLDAKKQSHCDLIRRSVAHWHSMPKELEGYSMTGASSMLAMMGEGNKAIEYLDTLMKRYIRPSTLYKENGGPVTETPLAAISSITDMLMQSYGGEISVFPACPDRWNNVQFTLFAEGGYKISASRNNKKLQYIIIEAKADSNVILHADFSVDPVCTKNYRKENGTYCFEAKEGERIVLKDPSVNNENFIISDHANNVFGCNPRTFEVVTR